MRFLFLSVVLVAAASVGPSSAGSSPQAGSSAAPPGTRVVVERIPGADAAGRSDGKRYFGYSTEGGINVYDSATGSTAETHEPCGIEDGAWGRFLVSCRRSDGRIEWMILDARRKALVPLPARVPNSVSFSTYGPRARRALGRYWLHGTADSRQDETGRPADVYVRIDNSRRVYKARGEAPRDRPVLDLDDPKLRPVPRVPTSTWFIERERNAFLYAPNMREGELAGDLTLRLGDQERKLTRYYQPSLTTAALAKAYAAWGEVEPINGEACCNRVRVGWLDIRSNTLRRWRIRQTQWGAQVFLTRTELLVAVPTEIIDLGYGDGEAVDAYRLYAVPLRP